MPKYSVTISEKAILEYEPIVIEAKTQKEAEEQAYLISETIEIGNVHHEFDEGTIFNTEVLDA